MTHRPSLTMFVASHELVSLKKISDANFLRKVSLDDIHLPIQFKGQLMAESRIYFEDLFRGCKSDFVGLCSPRWSERYPNWPSLENLEQSIPILGQREILAPQALRTQTHNIPKWIVAQDLVHPGISDFLFRVWRELDSGNSKRTWLPMGNTYILPQGIFREVIQKWDLLFPKISRSDFRDLNFGHICIKCGQQSEDGIGRWKSNRQASYFLERVVALILASVEGLRVVKLNQKGEKIKEHPFNTTRGLPWTALAYSKVSQLLISPSNCNHIHFGPGK